MAYQISSSVVNVNVNIENKTVQLPPASTILGKLFLIRDSTGFAGFPNTITVSTTGLDTIDYQSPPAYTLQLSTRFESVRLIAQNTSNYSILMRANNTTW